VVNVWSQWIPEARRRAEQLLREETSLEQVSIEAISRAQEVAENRFAQLRARSRHTDPQWCRSRKELLEKEERIAEALNSAIQRPRIRLARFWLFSYLPIPLPKSTLFMDELQFSTLKQALLEWPFRPLAPAGTSTSPLLGRLRQILEPARTSGTFASLPDLMVLLRQLLLSRSSEALDERLSIPQEAGWPDHNLWQGFGFDVTRTATRYLLEVRPWRPDWLGVHAASQGDVFADEHQAAFVRRDARLPTDPFLREITGFDHYVCPGQREALLSALFMPPGTTLVVNLPTGSGKSLVAQAPFLVRWPQLRFKPVRRPHERLGLGPRASHPGVASSARHQLHSPTNWPGSEIGARPLAMPSDNAFAPERRASFRLT
jgi:hypothetical protein